jgi:uncharacterized cupin superfamily protein
MVPEASYEQTESGAKVPVGDGWFVINAAEARWVDGHFGGYTRFEGETRFPLIGFNIAVLAPGQPACMYHGEDEQEDFLVLSGEALLLIEGQERRLRAWDFVHCPAWAEHVFIGAGERGCTVLAVGTRLTDRVVYPESELARRHGAGVEKETRHPSEAYAGIPDDQEVPFQPEWLSGLA